MYWDLNRCFFILVLVSWHEVWAWKRGIFSLNFSGNAQRKVWTRRSDHCTNFTFVPKPQTGLKGRNQAKQQNAITAAKLPPKPRAGWFEDIKIQASAWYTDILSRNDLEDCDQSYSTKPVPFPSVRSCLSINAPNILQDTANGKRGRALSISWSLRICF